MTDTAAAHVSRPVSVPHRPWGATASLNYNAGPWTVGGYYQLSLGSAQADPAQSERLSAFELGASYRFTTRLRLNGAWLLHDLTNDRRSKDASPGSGSAFTLGLRATL
jgi:predicted porin